MTDLTFCKSAVESALLRTHALLFIIHYFGSLNSIQQEVFDQLIDDLRNGLEETKSSIDRAVAGAE